jgi:hypothetical protein
MCAFVDGVSHVQYRRPRGRQAWAAAATNTMAEMNRNLTVTLLALLLGASAGTALGGCGSSQTKTVSVAGGPAETQSTATSTTTPAPTSTAGGTAAPGGTHSAPEPAFTQQEAHSEGLSEALAVVKARGYTPIETSQYHPTQTLRVLLASNDSTGGSSGQQAFFFVNGRYIGTDTKEPSANIKVIAQSDTEITLGYSLYRPNDALSSPSGGQAVVRFQLNNGKLASLNQIPPAHSSTGLSRN